MRVLLDTNILIDFFTKRNGFGEPAREVMFLLKGKKKRADGYISAHTVMDLCYYLRKEPRDKISRIVQRLCRMFEVVGTTQREILNAAKRMDFKDFEDSVVNQAAVACEADYIITRDFREGHFNSSDVPIISPTDFLKLFIENEDIR